MSGPDNSISKRIPMAGVLILIVVLLGLVVDTTTAGEDTFYASIIQFEQVAAKIHQNYVEEVSSKEMVKKAIDGMLEILDPHTTYFEPKEFDDLMVHTEGKFGGLGIQISIQDKVLTVMTPIPGTPAERAGLQTGDQIIKINSVSTAGIKTDEAVGKLRGEPGTQVTITIRRNGEKDVDYTITREIIHIKSVPYYGMLSDGIGYVRLNGFSEVSGTETEKALRELLAKNPKGMIFDLRSNPGGLLEQANEISEKFLPKGSLVVQTRGRIPGQNKEFKASGTPVLPEKMPLIVLVNRGSASASEIVAGAIQDWDRGVIMGDTTFGKGSVQSILPVDKEHHLKLTTAFYYTPSGRCINRPENGIRGMGKAEAGGGFEMEGLEGSGTDSLQKAKADSVAADSLKNQVFYTKGRRIVYGSGGIIPDTIVDLPRLEPLIMVMLNKGVFFSFANIYQSKLKKKKIELNEKLTIDEGIFKDFYSFLDSVHFEYKSPSQIVFDDFKKRIGLVTDTIAKSADSTKSKGANRADSIKTRSNIFEPQWTKPELKELDAISAKVQIIIGEERKREYEKSKDDIKTYIKDALLAKTYGQENEIVYRSLLQKDPQVKAAIGLLTNSGAYANLLKPGK